MEIDIILRYLDEVGIDYEFMGNKNFEIIGFSSLYNYKKATVTWVKKEYISESNSKIIDFAIIQNDINNTEVFVNYIKTTESKRAFFLVLEHFFSEKIIERHMGENTYISSKVKIGKNVKIGHNCVLDGEITIGDDTTIWNNVTIVNKCIVGINCEIQSGTVIGHDGFGYSEDSNGKKHMIQHFGGVDIGDFVHIGCNVIINRGTIDDTIIESGCKIDAQNFIAHNVHIQQDVALIVGNKIYGSSRIGENAYLATSIVRNQCQVGANAIVGMGSTVTKNVKKGTIVVGTPAKELKE